jgi:hypothetical protein
VSLGNAFSAGNTQYFISPNTSAAQSVTIVGRTGNECLFQNASNMGVFCNMSANTTTPPCNTAGTVGGGNTGQNGNTGTSGLYFLAVGASMLLTCPWNGWNVGNLGGVSAVGLTGLNTGSALLLVTPGWGQSIL